MKKRNLKVLFCVILLISLICPSIIADLAPPLEMITTPFSPTPVSASEEENVDSFNVHPVNRWDESTTTVFTKTIDNGIFNITGVGDGGWENQRYGRGLRSLDDKIELLFYADIQADSADGLDRPVTIRLEDPSRTDQVLFYISGGEDGGYLNTTLDITYGATSEGYNFAGTKRIYDETWYKLTIKYDLLKSECNFDLDFKNGTGVWRYDVEDLMVNRPNIYAYEAIDLSFSSAVKTNTLVVTSLWDWIEAPFKEREWVHFDDSADANWLSSSAFGHYVEDDVDDYDGYRLCVPYLDSVSVEFDLAWDAYGNTANGDNAYFFYRIYTVDGDDGGLAEAFEIKIGLSAGAAGQSGGNIGYDVDGVNYVYSAPPSTDVDFVLAKANFYMNDDRSEMTMQFVGDVNDRDFSNMPTITRTVILSDVSVDYSSEFVIEHYLYCNFDGNSLECKQTVGTCNILERDMFTGPKFFGWLLSTLADNPVTAWLAELMVVLFRFLGEIFGIVGDLIVAAVAALEPILGLIRDAVNSMGELLETAIGFVQTAIAAVAQDILDFIGDFIDDGITHMLTIIASLVGLFAAIIFAIYDGLFEDVFGFAEAPDLLALMYQLGVGAIQLVIGLIAFIPAFATNLFRLFDLIPAIGLFCFLVLPLLQSDSLGGFFSNALHNMAFDISFDFRPFGLGFHIPVVIPWLLISMATVFSDTIYAGFF